MKICIVSSWMAEIGCFFTLVHKTVLFLYMSVLKITEISFYENNVHCNIDIYFFYTQKIDCLFV